MLRTVLIRSAPFARHRSNQVPPNDDHAWQDRGRQERRFWLLGGKGECDLLARDRRAAELQTPAEYVMDSTHGGTMPWEMSHLEVSHDLVEVLAYKRSEKNQNDRILRLQERSGRSTHVKLRSVPLDLRQEIALRSWELKTLRLSAGRGGNAEIRTCDAIESLRTLASRVRFP